MLELVPNLLVIVEVLWYPYDTGTRMVTVQYQRSPLQYWVPLPILGIVPKYRYPYSTHTCTWVPVRSGTRGTCTIMVWSGYQRPNPTKYKYGTITLSLQYHWQKKGTQMIHLTVSFPNDTFQKKSYSLWHSHNLKRCQTDSLDHETMTHITE